MSSFSDRIYKGNSLIEDFKDYVVVDIETTSLDHFRDDEILEISAIRVRDKKEVKYFSKIIKIREEVGCYTTQLTGITSEMVEKEGEDLIKVLKSFQRFVGKDIIVGHNVNFDINYLYDSMEENLGEYLTNDFVDTLRLSRRLLPEMKHHKLDDLIDYFHLKRRNEHRALNDCVLTNQLYIKLCKMMKKLNLEKVVQKSIFYNVEE